MNPPSLIAATAGLKSTGTVGAAGSSTFTRNAAPSGVPFGRNRSATMSLLPSATDDQTTMKFPFLSRATAPSYRSGATSCAIEKSFPSGPPAGEEPAVDTLPAGGVQSLPDGKESARLLAGHCRHRLAAIRAG